MKEIQIKQDKRILFEYYSLMQKACLKEDLDNESVFIKNERAEK